MHVSNNVESWCSSHFGVKAGCWVALFGGPWISAEDREIFKVAGVSNIKSLVQRLGGIVKRKNFTTEMPKYRYLINVAAVLSSWRLVDMLATKSVLLLQQSWDQELIMEWLVPWEHYVPISPGLSDLVDKVQWLEQNQEIAESIAERSFQHFSERVRRQDTFCYIWQAFQTLADVQTPATKEELQPHLGEMKEVKPNLINLEKYGATPFAKTELWRHMTTCPADSWAGLFQSSTFP